MDPSTSPPPPPPATERIATTAPTLESLAARAAALLPTRRDDGDPAGIVRPAARPVRRLGVAVEPGPGFGDWARDERLDAVLVHRPWALEGLPIDPGVGVLAYHRALDERLDAWLAEALGGADPCPAPGHAARASAGVLASLPTVAGSALRDRIAATLGGLEAELGEPPPEVIRIAVMGAMSDPLVRWAAAAGAGCYLTGQLRAPCRRPAAELGLWVVAAGHARTERWAIGELARRIGAGVEAMVEWGG